MDIVVLCVLPADVAAASRGLLEIVGRVNQGFLLSFFSSTCMELEWSIYNTTADNRPSCILHGLWAAGHLTDIER